MNFLNIDQTGNIDVSVSLASYPDLSTCNNFQYDPLRDVVYTWHFDINEPYPSSGQDFTIYVLDATTGTLDKTIVIDNSDITRLDNSTYDLRAVHGFVPLHPYYWRYGYYYAVGLHIYDSNYTGYITFGIALLKENYSIVKFHKLSNSFSNDFSTDKKVITRLYIMKDYHYNTSSIYQILYSLNGTGHFWNFIDDTTGKNNYYQSYDYIGGIINRIIRGDVTTEDIYLSSSHLYYNTTGYSNRIGQVDPNSIPIYAFTLSDGNNFYPIIIHKYNNLITIGNEGDSTRYDIHTDSTNSTIPVKIAWVSFNELFIIREDSSQIEIYDLTSFNRLNQGGTLSIKEYKDIGGKIAYDPHHFDPNGILWYNLNYPTYYFRKMPTITTV